MNSFIEEFYYGNIDPQARSSEQNKKVQRDMQMLNESEDFLTDKLSGEEKKRFLQYVDAWAAVNGESTGLSERRDIKKRSDSAIRQGRIRILCFYYR